MQDDGNSMKLPGQLNELFRPPRLTPTRIGLALAAAAGADALQFFIGPLGWVGADQIIDVAALVLTTWAIGFHLLLLPTFVTEAFPVVDMLPTWTACVIAVITWRKRQQNPPPPPPNLPPPPAPPVIAAPP